MNLGNEEMEVKGEPFSVLGVTKLGCVVLVR